MTAVGRVLPVRKRLYSLSLIVIEQLLYPIKRTGKSGLIERILLRCVSPYPAMNSQSPNAVEWPVNTPFTDKQLRRGVFTSVKELAHTIDKFIAVYNDNPKPFVWSAKVDDILRKIGKCKAILETVH